MELSQSSLEDVELAEHAAVASKLRPTSPKYCNWNLVTCDISAILFPCDLQRLVKSRTGAGNGTEVQNFSHSLHAGKTFPAMVSVHWKFVHVFNRDFGSEPGSQAPGLHFSDPGPWYFLFWMGAETSVNNNLRQCNHIKKNHSG